MADPSGVLWGVDVHPDYQAGISFPTLAAEGYAFAVTKVTQGTWYTAGGYDSYIRAARRAGLIPGAYHWLNDEDGTAQCKHFLDRLDAVGGPDGLLIQLDVEDNGYERQFRDWLTEFWSQHPGHPVLSYSGAWWWPPHMGSFNAAALGPVHSWHSHYVPGQAFFGSVLYDEVDESWWRPGYGGWDRATILQYSSKATAGGIVGNVDVNAFKGTRDQLTALTRAEGDDMPALTELQAAQLNNAEHYLQALFGMTSTAQGGISDTQHTSYPASQFAATFRGLLADVAELKAAAGAAVDLDALADRVVAKLGPALLSKLAAAERAEAAVLDGTSP